MSDNNALAVVQKQKFGELRVYLGAPTVASELQKAMPKGLTPERLLRQTFSLVQKDARLLECPHKSILAGIMTAAELGLELTGPLGQAWLIPRKVNRVLTACFQVGWKGLVQLAYRSPSLKDVTVRTVRANDGFEVRMGTEHRVIHNYEMGERGEVTHYYALAHFVNGGSDFEVWSKAQAEHHRDRYAASSGAGSAWATHFDAMACKSVLSALCRRLSLCPEAQAAATEEHYAEAGISWEDRETGRQGDKETRTKELLGHLSIIDAPQDEVPAPEPEAEPAAGT